MYVLMLQMMGATMWLEKFIEAVFSLGLFINAVLFVPQIIRLYKSKHANDVSLLTFGGFWLIQVFIVLHGVINHDKLLIIGYSLSLLSCGIVVLLILMYRIKNMD